MRHPKFQQKRQNHRIKTDEVILPFNLKFNINLTGKDSPVKLATQLTTSMSREVGENWLSRGILREIFSQNGDFETRSLRFKASSKTASQASGVLPTAFRPIFADR